MITITAPTAAHIAYIVDHLRKLDAEEVRAATGQEANVQIHKAVQRAGRHFCALVDDTPIALYGVADMNGFSKIGSPWLVGTDAIHTHSKAFLRQSKRQFTELAHGYDYLVNMVDARNKPSIDWLKWLGFTLYEAAPYGPYGTPFHKFDMGLFPA